MKALKIVIMICYLVVAVLGLGFALMYLFRGEFMPYHSIAVGNSWDEVDPAMQVLILALMRVSGGGWLALSFALIFFSIHTYRRNDIKLDLAGLIIGWSILFPTLYATLYVRSNSPADPPWYAAALAILVLGIGFILAIFRDRRLRRK
jgi:hypothetical protein